MSRGAGPACQMMSTSGLSQVKAIMQQVFIRSIYPYGWAIPDDPNHAKRLISGAAYWAKFETLLRGCLTELGFEVLEQQEHPRVPDVKNDARFRLYAHQNRRDVPGHLFYKQTHLPDFFTIDPLGWGADHSGMQSAPELDGVEEAEAERFVVALRRGLLETGRSKHPQPPRRPLTSLPDDYIFVPTQTPRDYVQRHHASITVPDFIRLIAEWAHESRQNVVFKLHPGLLGGYDDDLIEAVRGYAAGSDYVFCLDGNIHDLIANSRGVYTINSGVGFESLVHGKPVVTFGNCDYKWVTFRADARSLCQAREFVFSQPDHVARQALKFVYYYCTRHAFSVEDECLAQSRARLLDYLAGALTSSV